MKVDIHTLILVQVLSGFVQSAALFAQFRINRVYRGQGWMIIGNLFVVGGYLCLVFRDIPGLLIPSIVVNNALFTFGMLAVYFGIARFLDDTGGARRLLVLITLFELASLYFTFLDERLAARSFILALSLGSTGSAIAFALLGPKRRQRWG